MTSKTFSGQTVGEFMAVPHLPQKTYGYLTKLL